jgi:hypothetical protein
MKYVLTLLFSVVLWSSCKKNTVVDKPIIEPPVKEDSIPTTKYNLAFISFCDLFNKTPDVKTMANQGYKELSGIAASQKNEGVLYVHDDGPIKVIAITNKNGDDLGVLTLDGMSFSDVEDIAVGPGPDPSKSYIYLADIGDNNMKASTITIYRIAEPIFTNANAQTMIHINEFEKFKLSYSRGSANAETFMVDPITKQWFILTKENSKSVVYIADYPQSTATTTLLKAKAILNLDLLTAGDISPDGSEILLRDKDQIWYWKRNNSESILQTLLKEPKNAPFAVNEKQGEGICFSSNADGYLTDTETQNHPGQACTISFYKRIK